MTDVEDVRALACFDHIAGFENEVGMIHSIAHHFKEFGIERGSTVGLEFTFLTQAMMGILTHPHAKPKEVAVKDCTHILSELRIVNEAEEVERIRKAARVADIGMQAAVEAAQPGVEETHVAAAAEHAMRLAGAEGFSRTYVASGRRTNIAHGLPTRRKLETNDLVMIDLHPIVDGYSADMCRTICLGKPTPEYRAAYELFLKAQQTTIAKVKAGVSMVELEQALHGIIKDAAHGAHLFGPPIHGVGIEFEEAPLPPAHAFFHGEKAPKPLEANVVIAVGNCRLYIGPWGVRVEDTVLVGAENSAEALVTEMRNLPDVKLAPHDDDPRVMKATLGALERAGYRLEEYG